MTLTEKENLNEKMAANNNKGDRRKPKVFSIFEKMSDSSSSDQCKEHQVAEPLKIVSWNVAGLRACIKKGCIKTLCEFDADIIVLQETKCSEFPSEFVSDIANKYAFKQLYISREKNGGYAGVALLARKHPLSVECGINDSRFDNHARIIQAEFVNFYFVGVYVPNSGQKLVNLTRRAEWDALMREKLERLDKLKPVILAGDMNVAHQEIDLKNPTSNRNKTAGFTDQERADFARLLETGFIDVFRRRNPEKKDAYTFWSYMGNARARNIGWRIDYFVISERIYDVVRECNIHEDVIGSDHCPISMTIYI